MDEQLITSPAVAAEDRGRHHLRRPARGPQGIHMFVYLAYHLSSFTSAARRRSDDGASAVEYGLLVALIAAIIVIAVAALGTTLDGIFLDTEAAID